MALWIVAVVTASLGALSAVRADDAPGKTRVLLEHNPLANIGDIQNVVEVVKHGLLYPRSAGRSVTAAELNRR